MKSRKGKAKKAYFFKKWHTTYKVKKDANIPQNILKCEGIKKKYNSTKVMASIIYAMRLRQTIKQIKQKLDAKEMHFYRKKQ